MSECPLCDMGYPVTIRVSFSGERASVHPLYTIESGKWYLDASTEDGIVKMWQHAIYQNNFYMWRSIREYLYSLRLGGGHGADDEILFLARIAKYHQQHIEKPTEQMFIRHLYQNGYTEEDIETIVTDPDLIYG